LEEHVFFIFRVEGAEQETSVKAGDKLVSWSAYSSTLKIEATCFSETSVDFQRTTRRHIPEDGTLQANSCLFGSDSAVLK
jgi:hypothetical protein